MWSACFLSSDFHRNFIAGGAVAPMAFEVAAVP
jgi:hypothetical protein